MTKNITNFTKDNFNIRSITIDEKIYFVGRDVALSLGYSRPAEAVRKHTFKRDTLLYTIDSIDTPKQRITSKARKTQQVILINESGLYSLILKSKLPLAENFQYWVTSEVLPSIRKNGSYSINKEEPEYLKFGSLEYPMDWTWELSSVIEMYAKISLDKLNDMESTIKSIKDMLKHIHLRGVKLKKASTPIRFNSRLIKYDRYKQFGLD